MSDVKNIVIIGAGLSGDTAAATLRDAGFTGAITLVGDEPHRPYDRPPLSKAALAAQAEAEKVFFRTEAYYAEKNVTLVLNDAAAKIDPAAHSITLASGKTISYDKLLIAMGTRARRLRMLENTGAPVFYLRSLDDCTALRPRLVPGARVAIIGAGVIGMEVAASAVGLGCDVSVVEMADRVMARSVSPSVSQFIADYHAKKGVHVLTGVKITGVAAKEGRAVISLDGGKTLEADVLIAGIGAEPATELAQAAGLKVDDGVIVDRYTRTSDPDIHAAGDVARFESVRHEKHIRTEHWRHAIDQAVAAAHVMMGGNDHYEEQPWVWSDQYDLNIQITGEGNGAAEVVRGKMEDAAFIAFQLRDGHLVGAIAINQPRFKKPIGELVAAHAAVTADVLADPATDLKKLAVQTKG